MTRRKTAEPFIKRNEEYVKLQGQRELPGQQAPGKRGHRNPERAEHHRVSMRQMQGLLVALAIAGAVPALAAGNITIVSGAESGAALSADRLLGAPVANRGGERLGEVEDLVLGTDGTARYIVIAVGGVIDIGNKRVAVPYREATLTDEGTVVYDATRAELAAAPALRYDTAAAGTGSAREAYERDAEREMSEWSTKLERYYEQAKQQGKEAAGEVDTRLERAWSEVEQRWHALKGASSEAWGDAKQAFDRAWSEFKSTWEEARAGS